MFTIIDSKRKTRKEDQKIITLTYSDNTILPCGDEHLKEAHERTEGTLDWLSGVGHRELAFEVNVFVW